MMMPNDVKEARNEYLRAESDSARKQILREADEEFKRAGVQTYAPRGQSGRIVIE